MGRVAVVFTGGTISTAFDPVVGGNVPILDGTAILARTPGLDAVAEVVAIDRGRTPASHFTFADLLDIAEVVRSALADPAVDGAVIVQGTDTIEETAFCWDLVLDGPKPVVVTGAMRASDERRVRRAGQPSRRGSRRGLGLDARGGRRRVPRRHHRAGRRRRQDAHLGARHVREPERRAGSAA